jgi:hypothetical protein
MRKLEFLRISESFKRYLLPRQFRLESISTFRQPSPWVLPNQSPSSRAMAYIPRGGRGGDRGGARGGFGAGRGGDRGGFGGRGGGRGGSRGEFYIMRNYNSLAPPNTANYLHRVNERKCG